MRKFNSQQIDFIQDRAHERIYEIFEALDIGYTTRHDYLQCACPIHNGDNPRGLYWAMQSNHWKCTTRGCEQSEASGRSSSIFGLVRGALSNKSDRQCTFVEAISFVIKVLNLSDFSAGDIDIENMAVDKAIRDYKKKMANKKVQLNLSPLSDFIPELVKDTVYYPKRGLSSKTIDRYHISYCSNPKKFFYKRAFFPVLDEEGRNVLGWSGRSIYEKCNKCAFHHNTDDKCPDKDQAWRYAKWLHSKNMRSEKCLYNYWFSRPLINKYASAIICEGPGDVWSLEEAGIKNSVAMMGISLSKEHVKLLQKAGALTLVFALDNDDAGRKAQERLTEILIHSFKLVFVTPENAKDVGEMMHKDIREKMIPILKTVKRHEMRLEK